MNSYEENGGIYLKEQLKVVNVLYFEPRIIRKSKPGTHTYMSFEKAFEKIRSKYQKIREINDEIKVIKKDIKDIEQHLINVEEIDVVTSDRLRKLHESVKIKIKKRDSKLVYSYAGEAARLSTISIDDDGYYHILFERLYTNDLPIVTEIDGESEAINIEKNEFIGHQANVLYDYKNSIFMIQRNRNSLGPKAIEEILRSILSDSYKLSDPEIASFHLGLLMDDNARQNALKKDIFKKFHIEVIQDSKNDILGVVLPGAPSEEIESIEITLKGKKDKKSSIPKDVTVELIAKYVDDPDTKKLDIKGKDHEDSPVEPVDLLNQKLITKLKFLLDATKHLRPDSVFEEMKSAYIDKEIGTQSKILNRRRGINKK